jgi:pyridoxal phosphate enzyme (YggS family)
MESLAQRYHVVQEQIEQAARAAGRRPEEITLVVVTKGHGLKEIADIHELGAAEIGENRVGEALEKQAMLDELTGLAWHMIGHVQSRKASDVAGRFSLVHSVDSVKLAERLDRSAGEAGVVQPVLLQINVSGEASKYGYEASRENEWDGLLPEIEQIAALTHLQVRGLMTMAPYSPDPEAARPSFARLRRLREYLAGKLPQTDWSQLSMGMSGDFIPAIEEGATLLRIGTAIMGTR